MLGYAPSEGAHTAFSGARCCPDSATGLADLGCLTQALRLALADQEDPRAAATCLEAFLVYEAPIQRKNLPIGAVAEVCGLCVQALGRDGGGAELTLRALQVLRVLTQLCTLCDKATPEDRELLSLPGLAPAAAHALQRHGADAAVAEAALAVLAQQAGCPQCGTPHPDQDERQRELLEELEEGRGAEEAAGARRATNKKKSLQRSHSFSSQQLGEKSARTNASAGPAATADEQQQQQRALERQRVQAEAEYKSDLEERRMKLAAGAAAASAESLAGPADDGSDCGSEEQVLPATPTLGIPSAPGHASPFSLPELDLASGFTSEQTVQFAPSPYRQTGWPLELPTDLGLGSSQQGAGLPPLPRGTVGAEQTCPLSARLQGSLYVAEGLPLPRGTPALWPAGTRMVPQAVGSPGQLVLLQRHSAESSSSGESGPMACWRLGPGSEAQSGPGAARCVPDSSSSGDGDESAEPTRHLWIGNLGTRTPRALLKAVFDPYGTLDDVVTFPGRMYAFVNYRTTEEALRAVAALQDRAVSELSGERRLLLKFRPARKAAAHLRALGLVDDAGAPTPAGAASCCTDNEAGRDGGAVADPSPRIWLGNIAPTATAGCLHAVLGRYGALADAAVFPARIGPLGYAFVKFEELCGAMAAFEALNNSVVPLLTGTKQLKMRYKPAYDGPAGRDDAGGDSSKGLLPPSRHLWLGNVTQKPSDASVLNIFGRFGKVDSVRVFPAKAYAFVNYASASAAAAAMTSLNGAAVPSLTGVKPLVMRFQQEAGGAAPLGSVGERSGSLGRTRSDVGRVPGSNSGGSMVGVSSGEEGSDDGSVTGSAVPSLAGFGGARVQLPHSGGSGELMAWQQQAAGLPAARSMPLPPRAPAEARAAADARLLAAQLAALSEAQRAQRSGASASQLAAVLSGLQAMHGAQTGPPHRTLSAPGDALLLQHSGGGAHVHASNAFLAPTMGLGAPQVLPQHVQRPSLDSLLPAEQLAMLLAAGRLGHGARAGMGVATPASLGMSPAGIALLGHMQHPQHMVPPQHMPPLQHQGMRCPLSGVVMVDPVVAADGFTYERRAISDWLAYREVSPVTERLLPHSPLIPAGALAGLMRL